LRCKEIMNYTRRSLWTDIRFGIEIAVVLTGIEWLHDHTSRYGLLGLFLSNLLISIVVSVVGLWVMRHFTIWRNRAKPD